MSFHAVFTSADDLPQCRTNAGTHGTYHRARMQVQGVDDHITSRSYVLYRYQEIKQVFVHR